MPCTNVAYLNRNMKKFEKLFTKQLLNKKQTKKESSPLSFIFLPCPVDLLV